ncbi:iron complex outermembrane recepter protein [Maribacter dokdonensis]|uniref:Iron complex outermembrane recepter protein n=1 Tax=Maribacter dokdonensis TaxID=320912 RepID=A0A1H4SJ61_9FLAO|nr:TonB-dependent receptor [Maribacter dokdonensis]SEC44064.1 iron complex outermembrane recepter protein [Maribacter dokdonensis]
MKKLFLLISFLVSTLGFSQTLVTGKITDQNGEPLPGASVSEKGTSNGVISDFNGNFDITITSEEAVLSVSFIGFETKEIIISGQSQIDIELLETAVSLTGVTVQGFSGVMGKSRKRTESIQTTPESVTALNAEGIESAGITDVSSFSTLVPNLKFNSAQSIGLNFITVRGIPQVRGGDAPLAFVIDGVTIPDPSLLSQDLYDLALVEVVKGPQGALYGKNAIGGAVNIYTKDPTNKMNNQIKIGVGNGGFKQAQFVSSGAIAKDKLFYRFSTQYKDFDGLLTNEFLDEKVDFREDINVRGQLKAKLSSNFSMTGSYQYFNIEGGATYYSVNPTGTDGEFTGGILDPNPSDGNNVIFSDVLGRSDMNNSYGTLNMDYNLTGIKLQSITSINKVERSTNGDLDFLELDGLTQGEEITTKTFNQEIRINNTKTDTKFDWSLGGFYQKIEKDFYQNGTTGVDFGGPDAYDTADYINETQTIALFGFGDYKLTDKLTLSAGFRLDMDKFTQDDALFVTNSERDNNEFQPKVSFSYQANKNILVYANYGRGYRNGGFNAQPTDLFYREFDDETSDNYELGFKTTSWNDRLILNGSVFYSSLNNQQQYILDLTTFIAGVYNYDKSDVFGFELESRARLTNFLDIFANIGVTDAKIVEGGTTGGDDGTFTNNSAYDGQKTPFVPVSTFAVGLESSFNITDYLKFNGFLNMDTTGKTYWHESNRDAFTTDAYSLLDARFGISYKNWKLEFWGKNLTDKEYYQEFSPGEFVGSPDDVAWRGQPLTVGTAISVKF